MAILHVDDADLDVLDKARPGDTIGLAVFVGRVEVEMLDVSAYGRGREVLPGEINVYARVTRASLVSRAGQ